MKTTYEISGWSCFSEKAIHSEGYDATTNNSGGEDCFKCDTIQECVKKAMEFVGGKEDDIEYNACGEIGRIDIRIIETTNSDIASEKQIRDWKSGVGTLWNSVYTFRVQRVIRTSTKIPEFSSL